MGQTSIYINIEDCKTAEVEERDSFIKNVLNAIGIDGLDDIWPDVQIESVEDKIKFRRLMQTYDIDILYDGDRGVKIYVDDDMIAEWKKPRFILRSDPSARNPRNKTFYEMIIDYWSMFEQGENDE